MPNYIINKNKDTHGYNEIHETTCGHLPELQNRISLGWHANSKDALSHAKSIGWKDADGCYYCCNEIHHG